MSKNTKINLPVKSLITLCWLTMISIENAQAGFYKGLDDDGNISYSDKPFASAKELTPPGLSVVDAVEAPAKKEVTEETETEKFKYSAFSISSPKNQQTIWNEPALTISLNLKPSLNTEEKHTVWLFMDGKPVVKNSTSLNLAIGRAERGQHQFQAHIRDKAGKVIKQTKSVTVHIKNTVIPINQR